MANRSYRIVLACLFLVALSYGLVVSYIFTHKTAAPAADIGGPFALTDQNNQPATDATFRGRYMLLTFGYTACPDICPMQLELMRAALDKLGKKANKVAPVFVTLDPDHDTPAQLHDYMAAYNDGKSPAITALTGPMDALDRMAKTYRIYYEKTPIDGAPGSFMIDHSVAIFLMDSDGAFVQSFTSPTPDELAAGIEAAL